jgi:citrate lyase subunit beta-like protein
MMKLMKPPLLVWPEMMSFISTTRHLVQSNKLRLASILSSNFVSIARNLHEYRMISYHPNDHHHHQQQQHRQQRRYDRSVPTTNHNINTDHTTQISSSSSSLFSHQKENEEKRLRRCLFSVPGSKQKMLQKSKTLIVDSIVYDLEDGVPYHEKELARQYICDTLHEMSQEHPNDHNTSKKQLSSEICIRINGLDTSYFYNDLKTLIPCTKIQAIVIPKVESLSDLMTIHDIIQDIIISSSSSSSSSENHYHHHRDIRFLAAIESARGLLNLQEIAEFNHHMKQQQQQQQKQPETINTVSITLDGLIFASEDYCANVEAIRTEHGTELLYARSQLVTVAKAYSLQAIDMVHINFRDMIALQNECQNAKELGYNGKQAIHPNQIEVIQSTFIPSQKDILFAKQCHELFHGTPIEINGIVVDTPVYKWAIKILNRAQAAGILV